MPEAFVSGGYYTNTNSAPYQMPFQGYGQQPAWSTGTNSQPQGFDHSVTNYSFGGLPPGGASDSQFMTPDHLFSASTSGFANSFTAPYVSGTGWSYFNNPSPFYFPTGNTDLNLSWGTAENPNGPIQQDLYKPPPPAEHEKAIVEQGELSGFENGELQDNDSVEKKLSQLSVTGDGKDSNDLTASISGPVSTKASKTSASNAPSGNAPEKPASWAAVAGQPAKPKPLRSQQPQKGPVQLQAASKPSYASQNGNPGKSGGSKQQQQQGNSGRLNRQNHSSNGQSDNASDANPGIPKDCSKLLRDLWTKNNFNPKESNMDFRNARFFIIKSYSEDDIFRSIKYSIWTSTEHGNRRLNEAYKEQSKIGNAPIYLLFSVNSSGHFCGIAQMMSSVDIHVETGVWVQDKWKGRFEVKWIYVKDVPNNTLRQIRLENNENKPITNSRDTQEVPIEKGKQVVKIMQSYRAQTSIFDDFSHYEQRQEEDARVRVSSHSI